MDNDLTIQLRVLSAGLDKLDQAKNQVNGLDKAVTAAAGGGMTKFFKSLESTGSRLNVLGQRLTFMAGVPLLLFANNAIKTAVEVERSWVRLNKVFNGTIEEFDQLKIEATNLSNTFGRPVEEIIEVMTEFNKAGVTGNENLTSLSKTVSETAILFDTDMSKALEGTKSVMMGYNLTAKETESAIAAINIIADKTTASEQGVLDVMNRAAGTARQAGFSFRELAASQAVFEKNAIPAGRAGNAMKSILVSLTKQSNVAKDQFRDLGVNMSSLEWRSANAGDKLAILSKKLLEVKNSGDKAKLADLNEAMASLVGKFQINNLNVLLEDMAAQFDNNADTVSQFGEALRVSADETENLKFKNQQLAAVMESSPMKLDIMTQMYRNQQIIIGNELLPLKLKLLEVLTKLLEKYNSLSPQAKEWVVNIGVAIVVLGPLLAALGLVITALGFLGTALTGTLTVLKVFGSGISQVTMLMGKGGMLGGITALALAWAAFTVAKAVDEFNQLQRELEENKKWLDSNAKSLDEMQKKVGSLKTDEANKQLQNAIDKSREADKTLKELSDRYNGLGGAVNAVKDQFSDWGKTVSSAIKKVSDAWDKADFGGSISKFLSAYFSEGGIVSYYDKGGPVYAANGFVPRGTDTVPAMLTPGEMVLTKGQQSELFNLLSGRNQGSDKGSVVVNINVGNMVASRGEQREFARQIQTLLEENDRRFVTA